MKTGRQGRRTMSRLKEPVWVALAVLVLAAGAVKASNPGVGAITRVANNVYGTPPEASREPQHAGDPVAFQELLETLNDSAALVRFIDGSDLTVGAQSKVLVDQFVFNPQTGSGNALISITSGALRFATGAMPKGKTVIDTPTATLTLRGTVVRVGVGPNGETDLVVDAGTVGSHNKLQNTDQDVPEGSSVTISSDGTTNGNGDVGDTFVDNGFGEDGNGADKVEVRREHGAGNSKANGGQGNSGGGSTGGSRGNGRGPNGN
jgi:hypothetical protein